MSFNAASALAFAALFWAAVGPIAPRSVCGATSITHEWRDSGVVASVARRASISSGATVTPSWAASFAWYLVSMSRSRVVAGSDWRCWAMVDWSDVPWASVRWPAVTAVRVRASASSRRQVSIL